MRNRIVFIVGLLILTAATIFVGRRLIIDYMFISSSTKASATIIDYEVNTKKKLLTKSNYIVKVEYLSNGEYFKSKLVDYNKHPQNGDKLAIYINKKDATNIRSNINYVRSFTSLLVIALVYVILIFPNMKVFNMKRKIKKLLKKGAVIVKANINNGSYLDDEFCDDKYWYLSCNSVIDGVDYEFKSIKLPFNNKSYFSDNNIKNIDVYVIKNNPNIYCVDVIEALKYNPKK